MEILKLDHLVLTVTDIDTTCDFYASVLGMEVVSFGNDRKALKFGEQKINLHQIGREFLPKAKSPTPGSADLCFITLASIDDIVRHLTAHDVGIEVGPVDRTGALGPIRSVYFRDPDDNLLEVSNYLKS